MTSGTLSGILTIAAFLAFLGVVFWAFSPRRKADFDSAARLPLNDDPLAQALAADEVEKRTKPSPAPKELHDKEAK